MLDTVQSPTADLYQDGVIVAAHRPPAGQAVDNVARLDVSNTIQVKITGGRTSPRPWAAHATSTTPFSLGHHKTACDSGPNIQHSRERAFLVAEILRGSTQRPGVLS